MTVGRFGWTTAVLFVVLFFAWWGLRSWWWRMGIIIPAFGVGVLAGIALTLWLGRPRRERRPPRY